MEWENLEDFERYPNLSEQLKEVGDNKEVTFCDDGRDVKAELIQGALKEKGHKNIKARDSVVFHVKDEKGKKDYEVWLSQSSFTNLRELKSVRDSNGKTLKGAFIKVSRVSKDDMTQPAFKFEKA